MFKTNIRWMSAGALILILLLLTALTLPAMAGETRSGQVVTVKTDEVILDDLYCFGETITIDGTIEGDLIAAGNEIRINGTIRGDLIAAARTIVINGQVLDDARIAGFDLEIAREGAVGDDINAAAFSLAARSGSRIGGDVYVIARQVDAGGQIDGKLVGSMDAMRITGTVNGDVIIEVSAPDPGPEKIGPLAQLFPVALLPSGLHVSDSAQIKGELAYTSAGVGDISPGADIEQKVYSTPALLTTPTAQPEGTAALEFEKKGVIGAVGVVLGLLLWIIGIVRRFISLLVIMLLLLWVWPVFPKVTRKLRENPWPSLGWGCLAEIVFFVAMPIVFVLILAISVFLGLLTLGGLQGYFISLALLLQGLFAVIFGIINTYVTKVVVAYFVGGWILARLKAGSTRIVWPTVLGLVVIAILQSIPILGWFIGMAATLFGLGAIWLWLRDYCCPPKSPAQAGGTGTLPTPPPAAVSAPEASTFAAGEPETIVEGVVSSVSTEPEGWSEPVEDSDVEGLAKAGAEASAEAILEPIASSVEEESDTMLEPAEDEVAEDWTSSDSPSDQPDESEGGDSTRDEKTGD